MKDYCHQPSRSLSAGLKIPHRIALFAVMATIGFSGHAVSINQNIAFSKTRGLIDLSIGSGVTAGTGTLSGNAFGKHIGWVGFGDGSPTNGTNYSNVGGDDMGVNMDNQGNLSGYAFNAAVGLIRFDWPGVGSTNRARVDLATGRLAGLAFNPTIGLLDLSTFSAGTTNAPEIAVGNQGVAIADGGNLAFRNGVLGGAFGPEVFPLKTITITNLGSGTLTGVTVTIDGTDAAMFNVLTNPAPSLAADATASFTVRFVPTSGGSKTAVLHIASNDADENPYDITLNATALVPDISISSGPVLGTATALTNGSAISFPSAIVGGQVAESNAVSFHFEANQTGVVLSNYTINPPGQFVISSGISTPFAMEIHNRIDVKFTPTNTGPQTATMSFISNDPAESPFTVTLNGNGLIDPATQPEISVRQPQFAQFSPVPDGGSRNFGGTSVGGQSSLNFSIHNTGGVNLTGLTTSFTGADATMFTVVTNPVAPVAPNGNTRFSVRFSPTSPGTKTAVLHIANNDADEGPYDIALTGTGENNSLPGLSWTPRDSKRKWSALASSHDGIKLLAATYGGQLYTSADAGTNWIARESNRNWYKVASSVDGTTLLAAVQNGQLYVSTNSGAAWSARENNRNWSAVACSANGTRMIATVSSGQIYVSSDSGNTWTARESNRGWSAVSSSADGTRLAAAVLNDHIYTSTDSGVTWTARESKRFWFALASSADGNRLVAADAGDLFFRSGGGRLHTSTNSGASWTPVGPIRNWNTVASSSDGSRLIAASLDGQIHVSIDGGATWSPRESDRAWTAVASSGDGTRLVAAGGANGGETHIHTSSVVFPPEISVTYSGSPIASGGTSDFGGIAPGASVTREFHIHNSGTGTLVISGLGLNPSGEFSLVASNGLLQPQPAGITWAARESDRKWGAIASSADGSRLVAAGEATHVYTSIDSGLTWTARDSSRTWLDVASSADGTKLVAGASDGLYTSADSGVTWSRRASSLRNGVASSADGTKLAAVSGNGQIYTSTDSGASWTARGPSGQWWDVASSADGSRLVAAQFNGRIYTSTDSGVTWTAREGNRFWHGVSSSADGTRLVAIVLGGRIYTSTDGGANWTARESSRNWWGVTSSSDGSKIVATVAGGQVYVSTDAGISWTARESTRGWQNAAMSDDGSKLAAVANPGRIYTSSAVTANVPTGSSGRIALRFAPTSAGSKSATLSIVNNDADENPYTIHLTGGNATAPEIGVSQAGAAIADGGSRSFGNVVTGGQRQLTFSITNSGTATLTGLALTLDGANASLFTVLNYPAPSLAAGATASFTVRFAPTSGGSQTAVLHIASNDADENPYDITLNATALVPDISISAGPALGTPTALTNGSAISFPSAIVGSQVAETNAVSFHFKGNQSGIVLSNYTINSPGQFVVSSGLPTPVALELDTRIDLKFVPTNTGPQTATISFVSNDPDESPFIVNLAGNGQPDPGVSNGPPEIEILAGTTNIASHSTIAFGGVPVGTNTLRNLTVRNTGGSVLSITNIDIRSAVEFSILSDQPTNLPAGAEMTLGVRFAPTAPGTNRTQIRVMSNDSDESFYFLEVAGSGTLPPEDVEIEVLDGATTITNGGMVAFGAVNVGSAATRDLSVRNTGTTPLILAELSIQPSGGFSLAATNGAQSVPASLERGLVARDTNRAWVDIVSSADGSRLLAASGGDQSLGRLYVSANGGETWQARAFSNHWTSVASSANGMKLVAVAGGFEKHRQIHTSIDGGSNWTARASSNWWTSVASSTNGVKLVAGAADGIYTSADSGVTWTRRITTNSWRVASSADGSRLIAAGGREVLTSTDSGQSWNKLAIALQLNWIAVASSADGMKLALSEYYGRVRVSSDGGATWLVSPLGGIINGLSWSGDGSVLAATEGGGFPYVSRDGGASWKRGASDKSRVWTSVAVSGDGRRLAATETDGQVYVSDSAPVLSIAGGATATLSARYAPTATGGQSAHLRIGNNDADENPYVVNLTGTGGAIAVPDIMISATLPGAAQNIPLTNGASVEFPSAIVGIQVNQANAVSFNFNGNQSGIVLSNYTISPPGQFVIVNGLPTPVALDMDNRIDVKFAPTNTGPQTATITFVSNDPDESPFTVTLNGNGQPDPATQPEISVETTELQIADGDTNEFGNVVVGQSFDQQFTIRNTGNGPLNLAGITIDGTNPSNFTVVTNAVSPVATNGNTSFTVRFSPTSAGPKSAVLHIASNDTDEHPYDIVLTGAGTTLPKLLLLFPTTSESFNQFGEFQFKITGRPGFDYSIEAADTVDSDTWFVIALIHSDGSVQVVEDLDSPGLPQQFYRVIEIAP